MSHLISSCHMLALASHCEGSGMEGLTWTWFVFQGVLHVSCIQTQPFVHKAPISREERPRHCPLVHLENQVVVFCLCCVAPMFGPWVKEAWQKWPSFHFLNNLFPCASEKCRSCLIPLPVLWESSAGLGGTLENRHTSAFGFGYRHFWQNQ